MAAQRQADESRADEDGQGAETLCVEVPRPITPTSHATQNSWCLWYLRDNANKRESWCDQQLFVHEFNTIEGFWRMYHNILTPLNMEGGDYSLFKTGVMPAWEDKQLANGGRWGMRLGSGYRPLDKMWLNICLAMIGELLANEAGSYICGCVVKARYKFCKLELWVSRNEEQSCSAIGRSFQQIVSPFAERKRDCDIQFDIFNDQHRKYNLHCA